MSEKPEDPIDKASRLWPLAARWVGLAGLVFGGVTGQVSLCYLCVGLMALPFVVQSGKQ